MKIKVESNVSPTEWNELIKNSPDGTFYQTTYFADVMNELGFKTIFITASENNKPIGLLLAFSKGFGQELLHKIKLIKLTPLFDKIFPYIQSLHGPILLDSNIDPTKQILKTLIENQQTYEIECTPPIHDKKYTQQTTYVDLNFKVIPYGTFLIDLTQGDEKLWHNLDKSARKAITSCEEQGIITTKVETETDVIEYIQLLKTFRRKMNLLMPPLYPTLKFWKEQHGKHMDLYIAKQNGKIVSGMGIVYFNNIITEVAVARDLDCKAYAQDAIKWKIIKWGAENGFKTYDAAGVNPNPQTPKEKGAYQFKAKWGGKLVTYDKYILTKSKKRKTLINIAKNITRRKT